MYTLHRRLLAHGCPHTVDNYRTVWEQVLLPKFIKLYTLILEWINVNLT